MNGLVFIESIPDLRGNVLNRKFRRDATTSHCGLDLRVCSRQDALFDEMKSNDQQIESMKEQIEALTNRNVEASAAIEKITNTVQDELKMISSIEEFIEEDKTEPAGKEGA